MSNSDGESQSVTQSLGPFYYKMLDSNHPGTLSS